MKTCNRCDAEKDESEFYAHRGAKDGLQPRCKKCMINDNRVLRQLKGAKSQKPRAAKEGFKFCSKCDAEKPLEEFYAHVAMRSGRSSKCIECTRVYSKERYHGKADSR